MTVGYDDHVYMNAGDIQDLAVIIENNDPWLREAIRKCPLEVLDFAAITAFAEINK